MRPATKMRSAKMFKRNCWISFEPVEYSIDVLADYIAPHKIMWATDYPHQDGVFPGAPQMIRDQLGPHPPKQSTRCGPVARWGSTPCSDRAPGGGHPKRP